jgi:molecular chaperone IbpA
MPAGCFSGLATGRSRPFGGRASRLVAQEEDKMRSAFDFAPFRRSTVGFDRLFDMLEHNSAAGTGENYPPFDLIRLGDDDYRIEVAVAGFRPDEIDITALQNVLIVTGRKQEESPENSPNYIYRGIANRAFERRFALADHIKVRGADIRDGLLAIELVREIPETMKPRKIEIGSGERAPQHDRIGDDGRQPASQQTVNAEARNG